VPAGSVAHLGEVALVEVLTAMLAFAGAAVGAGVGYRASIRATGVEREARRREEWGRRFTAALTAVTASAASQVATGQALLLELVRSDLATEKDRSAARAVLEVVATNQGGVDLRLVVPPEDVESEYVVEETGSTESGKGDDG
jgi:hypothetical protein